MKKKVILFSFILIIAVFITGIAAYYLLFSMLRKDMQRTLERNIQLLSVYNETDQEFLLKKMISLRYITSAYDKTTEQFIGPPLYEMKMLDKDIYGNSPRTIGQKIYMSFHGHHDYLLAYSFDDYLMSDIYLRFLIPFYAIIIILMAYMYYVSYVIFIRPVSVITQSTKRIAEGDFNVLVPIEGVDEIQTLAHHFNIMAGRIRDSFQILHFVIDNLQVGFVFFTGNGAIVLSNTIAAQMYGASLEGKNIFDLFPFMSDKSKVRKFGENEYFSQTLFSKNGTPLLTDFVYTSLELEHEKGAMLIMQRREELLAKDNIDAKTIKVLSSVVAHEIKNPLNVIAMIIQILRKQYADDQKWDDIVEQINYINTVAANIGLMIDYKPEIIELRSAILEMMSVWKPIFNASGVTVDLNISDSDIVYFDRFKLKIIIDNIIKNALEESKGDLQLTLDVTSSEAYTYLSIIDNGNGFDAQELSKVIQSGYSKKERGSGMGLFIIRLLLALGSAMIEIKSEKGKQTRITMRFMRNEIIDS